MILLLFKHFASNLFKNFKRYYQWKFDGQRSSNFFLKRNKSKKRFRNNLIDVALVIEKFNIFSLFFSPLLSSTRTTLNNNDVAPLSLRYRWSFSRSIQRYPCIVQQISILVYLLSTVNCIYRDHIHTYTTCTMNAFNVNL